ncbi:MAG: metal ABC transporter ATP-binding protein [Verrucomicrobia bacterium]|nr:metal ABC transporter ATP-binding protein [Verrucomicrobiota bacterium]
MNAIEVEDVTFSYEETPILRSVSLDVVQGEFIGIIGPNGGGKTTLLKLLMGFLSPSKGSIRILRETTETARLHIGYVPQAHRFDREFPITVLELVLMGALSKIKSLRKVPEELQARAEKLIERLGLKLHREKAFGTLSGGLAQRALLARALLADPKILFLDEPTANIDPPSAGLIFEILEEMKGKKTILLVTHDLKTVIERVDRVICVEGTASSFLPKEMCEHFAFGLYHAPLLGLPPNHFGKKN